MISWGLGFFILAIIASVFGFGGIATSAAGVAQVLLVVFLVFFLISLLMWLTRGRIALVLAACDQGSLKMAGKATDRAGEKTGDKIKDIVKEQTLRE